jgi:signal transduction histidine kinase
MPLSARLTQILVNLLSNAIRFTATSEKREVTLAVEVSAQPNDRNAPLVPPPETEYKIHQKRPIYLFFSVEDTGPYVFVSCCPFLPC